MASGEIEVTPGRVLAAEELVDNQKLNDLGTPTLRIKEQAITTRELADGTITSDKLDTNLEAQLGVQDGSVTTAKIVNGAVTAAKMAEDAKIPVGAILDFAGTTPPDGWLLCGGQNVSRTTYALLFACIGTTWGAGDGTSTFAIPDLRGFVVAGKDDMVQGAAGRLTSTWVSGGGGPTALGGFGGVQAFTLTQNEMPVHAHVVPSHSHSASVVAAYMNYQGLARGGVNTFSIDNTTLGVSVAAAPAMATDNRGTGAAHTNLQPTRIMNKIIRYL